MSRVWQSVVSVWAWLVLALCILLWFPVMAVLRLVTAPFDPGRYLVGYSSERFPWWPPRSTRCGGFAGRG
jgi:hypothetical protein